MAYGVLATSSYYCSVSKTAALSLLLQPAILFYSLKHGSLDFSLPVSFYFVPQLSSPELSEQLPSSVSLPVILGCGGVAKPFSFNLLFYLWNKD